MSCDPETLKKMLELEYVLKKQAENQNFFEGLHAAAVEDKLITQKWIRELTEKIEEATRISDQFEKVLAEQRTENARLAVEDNNKQIARAIAAIENPVEKLNELKTLYEKINTQHDELSKRINDWPIVWHNEVPKLSKNLVDEVRKTMTVEKILGPIDLPPEARQKIDENWKEMMGTMEERISKRASVEDLKQKVPAIAEIFKNTKDEKKALDDVASHQGMLTQINIVGTMKQFVDDYKRIARECFKDNPGKLKEIDSIQAVRLANQNGEACRGLIDKFQAKLTEMQEVHMDNKKQLHGLSDKKAEIGNQVSQLETILEAVKGIQAKPSSLKPH